MKISSEILKVNDRNDQKLKLIQMDIQQHLIEKKFRQKANGPDPQVIHSKTVWHYVHRYWRIL